MLFVCSVAWLFLLGCQYTVHIQNKRRFRDRTETAWFSRFLRHPANGADLFLQPRSLNGDSTVDSIITKSPQYCNYYTSIRKNSCKFVKMSCNRM